MTWWQTVFVVTGAVVVLVATFTAVVVLLVAGVAWLDVRLHGHGPVLKPGDIVHVKVKSARVTHTAGDLVEVSCGSGIASFDLGPGDVRVRRSRRRGGRS